MSEDRSLVHVRDASAIGTELQISGMSWEVMKEQAKILVASGLLPQSIKTAEAAVAIMLMGKELGMGPMMSFQGIDFIRGVLAIRPKTKVALARKSGLVAKFIIKETEDSCEVTMVRKDDGSSFTSVFTMKDAQRAGLLGKDNWRSWPKNMLRWRAIGDCCNVLIPEVVGSYYTADEVGAETNADGIPVEKEMVLTGKVVEDRPQEFRTPVVSVPPASPVASIVTTTTVSVQETEDRVKEEVKQNVERFVDDTKKVELLKKMWQKTKAKFDVSTQEWREFIVKKWGISKTKEMADEQITEWSKMIDKYSNRGELMNSVGLTTEPHLEKGMTDAEVEEKFPGTIVKTNKEEPEEKPKIVEGVVVEEDDAPPFDVEDDGDYSGVEETEPPIEAVKATTIKKLPEGRFSL
jgi:hypothetical protein